MLSFMNKSNVKTELGYLLKNQYEIPKFVELDAEHGVVEDIHMLCNESEQKKFEQSFTNKIVELGMHITDEKQRVYQTRYSIDPDGTRIYFTRDENSAEQELFLEGIKLKVQPSQFGGGAFNLARTVDSLIGVSNLIKEKFPFLKNILTNFPQVQMSAILNQEQSSNLPIKHIKVKPIEGDCRISLIFHLAKQRFYFTKKKATTKGDSKYSPIIENQQSLILQQVPDYKVLKDYYVKQYQEKHDHLFWLLPKDVVDKGIEDLVVRDAIKYARIISFNLYEAARFTNQVPLEKYTPFVERIREAKIAAQTLHNIGVKILVITDEDKGAYVSIKKENGYIWKHFPISSTIRKWIDEEYLNSDYSGKEYILTDKMDFVGCGDSFAATVLFCSQYLGLKDWDFIFTFAHMIAGIVSRCKMANIGDLDPRAILQLFLNSIEQKNNEGWLFIGDHEDFSNPFCEFNKKHLLKNIEYSINHEVVILLGIPGSGRRSLVGALKKHIRSSENNFVKDIAKKYGVRLNSIAPIHKDDVSKRLVDFLSTLGHFVGGTIGEDYEENLYFSDEFTYKIGDQSTLDIVWAFDVRQAINLWFDLMNQKEVTNVRIINLDARKETLQKRLEERGLSPEVVKEHLKQTKSQKHRAKISEYSHGFALNTDGNTDEIVAVLIERVLSSQKRF